MTQAVGSVRVLEKASEILRALAANGPMKATAIAAALDEPRSSVYRLLRTMSQLDYVESGAKRGEYRLGLKLLQLGGAVGSRFSVRHASFRPMQELNAATGHTIFLFVRRNGDGLCLERIDGTMVRFVIVDVGETLPLHVGAGPRTLLAFLTEEEIDAYFETTALSALTERSPVTPSEVRELLAQVRADEVSISDQDVVDGIVTMAAPVRDHRGEVVAAISMSGAAGPILEERERLVAALTEAAHATSADLGWSVGSELSRVALAAGNGPEPQD
ncbi:MAG: IclR family transcriptional regulator [Thermoleophilia bacterium]|nr:IclR family transcriptional regulator [Thermoleophilia bacterium]